MTEEQIEQKAEEYAIENYEQCMYDDVKGWENDSKARKQAFIDGYHECQKEHEWHDINDIEPSKEQLGKQLLIKMESIVGNTDYAYLVYKYNGESITDVAGVIAWKEIE